MARRAVARRKKGGRIPTFEHDRRIRFLVDLLDAGRVLVADDVMTFYKITERPAQRWIKLAFEARRARPDAAQRGLDRAAERLERAARDIEAHHA